MEARVLNYIDRTTEETIKTLLLFCIHRVFYNSSGAIAHQEDEVRIRQIMKKKAKKLFVFVAFATKWNAKHLSEIGRQAKVNL